MPAIPNFVDQYHLENDEHICTFKDIEDKLLFSKTRERKWNDFMNLYNRMCSLGLKPNTLLIDGSFVTGRQEPGDVDCAALITPDTVRHAIQTSPDDHDKNGIRTFMNENKAEEIRDTWGAHLLVADNEKSLKAWSKFFRRGLHGKLREPDPIKDPPWVKRPKAKGILRVEL